MTKIIFFAQDIRMIRRFRSAKKNWGVSCTLNYNNIFCKELDQNEHFSPFEFSSAGIMISI